MAAPFFTNAEAIARAVGRNVTRGPSGNFIFVCLGCGDVETLDAIAVASAEEMPLKPCTCALRRMDEIAWRAHFGLLAEAWSAG